MNKERTSYKDQALSSLSRGEWKKALDSFQKHCAEEPEDLRSRLKKAELLERLGKKVFERLYEFFLSGGGIDQYLLEDGF